MLGYFQVQDVENAHLPGWLLTTKMHVLSGMVNILAVMESITQTAVSFLRFVRDATSTKRSD